MAGGEGKGTGSGGTRDFSDPGRPSDDTPVSGDRQRQEATRADQAERRLQIQEAREARAAEAAEQRGSTTVRPTGSTKTIVAMMAFATAFSVVGAEIRNSGSKQSTTSKVDAALSDPFLIILGGTTGAALLSLLALAGEAGRTLGVGLAGLTLVTALFVNGGPVWDALRNALSAKPTAPLTATTATTATKGTP